MTVARPDPDRLTAGVAYRMHCVAEAAGDVNRTTLRLDALPERLDDGTVFGIDTAGPSVLDFNGARAELAVEGGRFVGLGNSQRGQRTADQGNHLLDLGLHGVFLFNLVDAQNRSYPDCAACFGDAPVLHYCRPIVRRQDTALVPLLGYYSDVGSPNVPVPGYDEIAEADKIPQAVWRGAPSGTRQTDGEQQWLSGIWRRWPRLDPAGQDALRAQLSAFDRVRLVASAAGVAGINAGFAMKGNYSEDWVTANLPADMQTWFKAPMHRTRQLRFRYILAIEGNDIPSGLFWILASNSVALCGPRRWETVLDQGLEPWVHFVPVEPTAESVQARIAQLENDPALRRGIISNANAFMREATDAAFRAALDRACYERAMRSF